MVLVHERVESSSWIRQDSAKSLVRCGTSVLNFIENSRQDNNIFDEIVFENVNLIQDHIRVKQQVVRFANQLALRSRTFRQDLIVLLVRTNVAQSASAPDVGSQVMLANDLKIRKFRIEIRVKIKLIAHFQDVSSFRLAEENFVSQHRTDRVAVSNFNSINSESAFITFSFVLTTLFLENE